MVKKNALTPVLAGVLSLSVAGSGIGYYVMNKNSEENAQNQTGVEDSVKTSPKLSAVAQNIEKTFETAELAANGSLDYANTTVMTVSFGEGFTELAGGTQYDDIKVETVSKQKGGNNETTASFYYGDGKLVTVNEILNRDTNTGYVQIPELSDAYLTADKDSLNNYMKENLGYDFDSLIAQASDIDYDYSDLDADVSEYEKIVKENFPEVKEEGTVSGDISGVSYEYTTKSYTVTAADAKNIATAVLNRAKTDENFKSMYETEAQAQRDRYSEIYSTYDMDPPEVPSYEEIIDEYLKELDEFSTESEETVDLVVYENAEGDFAGLALKNGEEFDMNMVSVSSDEAEGVDFRYTVEDGTEMTVYGAIKLVDDALTGSYTIKFTEDNREEAVIEYTVTNVKAVGSMFTGTIRVDGKFDDGGETALSGWAEFTSNSSDDNVDLSCTFGYDGKNMFTYKVTSTKTEASDVELPAADAKTYNVTDEAALNEYLEACDLEGFQNNAKSVLGDELYSEMFESSYDYDYGTDYDDYDWETDDWDFDDEDWADYDWDASDLEGILDAATATGEPA